MWLAIGLAFSWGLLAFWYYEHWPAWVGIFACAIWAGGIGYLMIRPPGRKPVKRPNARRIAVITIALILLIQFWETQRPSNDRDWAVDQAHTPAATIEGDIVRINHLRNAFYRSTEDFDLQWEQREYDLAKLSGVEYVVEPFSAWRGMAHTLLTFSFDDGQRLAISVEIRKEAGETYSPIKGVFRQFELMYVIGDERDLIGLRAFVRNDPVYIFPLKAPRPAVRALLLSMLQRANTLIERPEYYNTLTNTCTTNLIMHFEDLTGTRLPIDTRIIFPGYSDSLAYDLNLIDHSGDLQSARKRFLVNANADIYNPQSLADGPAWSAKLRAALGQTD